ncbi:MAG: hypothetical protein GY730_09010 [bacterium]|nr:hypothetical protein [bacterium]
MSIKKLIAISLIFFGCFIAWMLLGGINLHRTSDNTRVLKSYVQNMYGSNLNISSPGIYFEVKKIKQEKINGQEVVKEYIDKEWINPSKSDVIVNVNLDPRKKGNLWFPTFKADFSGQYEFNVTSFPKNKSFFVFASLDSSNSIYRDIRFTLNNNIQNISRLVKAQAIANS